MGNLYRRNNAGKVIQVAEIINKKPVTDANAKGKVGNNINLVSKANQSAPAPTIEKVGKAIQKIIEQKPNASIGKIQAKSQPANEIVLKQTVKVADTQKTATFTNYRKAVDFLQSESQKTDFSVAKLEGLIDGEVRTTVLNVAEKIRTELTNQN